jgi:hypothetical protein
MENEERAGEGRGKREEKRTQKGSESYLGGAQGIRARHRASRASQVIWCYCRLRVAWTGAHIYDAGRTCLNCN